MDFNREKRNINELEKGAWHLYKATEIGHEKSLEKLKEIANMDIAYAQNCVGVCFAQGYYVERNLQEAVRWYMKAAKNGSGMGMYNLAWYYLKGEGGLITDLQKAYELYQEAAKLGIEGAQEKANDVKERMHTP